MTSRDRFQEIREEIGVRFPNDPLPRRWHDERGILSASLFNQDIQFLFSLVDAAVEQGKYGPGMNAETALTEDDVWDEIDYRMDPDEAEKKFMEGKK